MENKKLTRKERKAEWKYQVAQLFRLIDSYEAENLDLALTIMSGNRDLKEACKRRYYPLMRLIDPQMGSSWQLLYKVRETCENGYYSENDEYQYDFLNRFYNHYLALGEPQAIASIMQELCNQKYSSIYDLDTLEELLSFKEVPPVAIKTLYINTYTKRLKKLPLQHLSSLESLEISGDKKALAAVLPHLKSFTSLISLTINNFTALQLPAEIQFLTKLESISISEIEQLQLPEELHLLPSLNTLTISSCPITTVPDVISKLVNLKYLNINNCPITTVPDSFAQLQQLETLSLYANGIQTLPAALFDLPNLTSIDLDQNKIKELPTNAAFNAPLLATINIRENLLKAFPIQFARLPALAYLYISGCKIKELPAEIEQFRSLHTLNIETNKIETLPDSIGKLPNLAELYIQGTRIVQLPDTIRTSSSLTYFSFSASSLKKHYKKESVLAEALPPNCGISCY